MPAQLLQPPPAATTPAIDPPSQAWQPLRGTVPPPPPDRAAGGGGSGGRWGWPRKLAAAFLALGLALASGAAGAYTATSLESNTAVASNTATTVASGSDASETSLASVAAAVEPSVVSITVQSAGQQVEGSGVIIGSDGLILTNHHVVEDAQGGRITVEFSDGSTATASVAGTDPSTDLAVIQAEGVSGLQAATFGDSDALQVGDTVLAIGSPLGLEGSVTSGIVSALHRTFDVDSDGGSGVTISDAIQTDAPINPGNSGGPLVNAAGEVVGILTANASVGQDAGSIGVGFAIPANQVEQVVGQLTGGALTVAAGSTTG